jgi:hypothetical protein
MVGAGVVSLAGFAKSETKRTQRDGYESGSWSFFFLNDDGEVEVVDS